MTNTSLTRHLVIHLSRLAISSVLRFISALGGTLQQHAARRGRRLPRFFWDTESQVTVRRRRIVYELDLRDNVQRALYFTGWYERPYLEELLDKVQPDDVFVDVGAHIGIHTLAVARKLAALGGKGHIYAFEPATDTAEVLLRNVGLNMLGNVTVVQTALGSTEGTVTLRDDALRFDPHDSAVRSVYGPGEKVEDVAVMDFDTWAGRTGLARMDLLKIDVEGAEYDVLKGMTNSLRLFRPRWIGIEIREYLLEQAGVSANELRKLLLEAGYQDVTSRDLDGNCIFCLNEDIRGNDDA